MEDVLNFTKPVLNRDFGSLDVTTDPQCLPDAFSLKESDVVVVREDQASAGRFEQTKARRPPSKEGYRIYAERTTKFEREAERPDRVEVPSGQTAAAKEHSRLETKRTPSLLSTCLDESKKPDTSSRKRDLHWPLNEGGHCNPRD